MTTKPTFQAHEIGAAAFFSVQAVVAELVRLRVMDEEQANGAFATAASMAEANGTPGAAEIIRLSVPTCREVDPIQRARDLGITIDSPRGDATA